MFEKIDKKCRISDLLVLYEQLRRNRTSRISQATTFCQKILHLPDGLIQKERDRQLREEQPFEGFPNSWADPVMQQYLFEYDAKKEVELIWPKYLSGQVSLTAGFPSDRKERKAIVSDGTKDTNDDIPKSIRNTTEFTYAENKQKVIFGCGAFEGVSQELQRLGLASAVLLSTPEQTELVERLQNLLNDKVAGTFKRATMHTPADVTEEATSYVRTVNADCVVAIGGGSTTGLGKAISLRTGLPHICIPTTYAGSEMTAILGETANGKKTTIVDVAVIPGTVIYDPLLTMTLPTKLTAMSGMNAMAHAGEFVAV